MNDIHEPDLYLSSKKYVNIANAEEKNTYNNTQTTRSQTTTTSLQSKCQRRIDGGAPKSDNVIVGASDVIVG